MKSGEVGDSSFCNAGRPCDPGGDICSEPLRGSFWSRLSSPHCALLSPALTVSPLTTRTTPLPAQNGVGDIYQGTLQTEGCLYPVQSQKGWELGLRGQECSQSASSRWDVRFSHSGVNFNIREHQDGPLPRRKTCLASGSQ